MVKGLLKKPVTIPDNSKDVLTLKVYIEKQPPGSVLSFNKIAFDTGICMDTRGKRLLRSAFKRADREYSSIYGYGVKIADVDSVMPILSNRLDRIDRAVRRGESSHKRLQRQFFDSLDKETQRNILYIGACFGAIRVAAENYRFLFSRSKDKPRVVSSGFRLSSGGG